MTETRKQLITRLTDSGDLLALYKCGMLPDNVFRYRDISIQVHSYQAVGNSRMDAVTFVAEQFNVSIQTVYKAMKWYNT